MLYVNSNCIGILSSTIQLWNPTHALKLLLLTSYAVHMNMYHSQMQIPSISLLVTP